LGWDWFRSEFGLFSLLLFHELEFFPQSIQLGFDRMGHDVFTFKLLSEFVDFVLDIFDGLFREYPCVPRGDADLFVLLQFLFSLFAVPIRNAPATAAILSHTGWYRPTNNNRITNKEEASLQSLLDSFDE
jgi:hypothetical protein